MAAHLTETDRVAPPLGVQERRRCEALTVEGGPCGAPAMLDTEPARCWFHNPAREDQRAEARSLGGRSRRRSYERVAGEQLDVGTTEGIKALLNEIAHNLRQTDASPSVANSLTQVCRVANDVLVGADLEEQLQELERRLVDRERHP